MVDGDVDSAQTVTHRKIASTQNDGTTIIKQVLESLDTPTERISVDPKRSEVPSGLDNSISVQMDGMSPPPNGPSRKSRVSI